MIVSIKMITGFNTDVSFGGCLYHVQTEDRGQDHPFLESLVYVGGTIIAKKRTPYPEGPQGAAEATITSLLRRQHQVIIAAIKAGRIDELVRHSAERKGIDPDSEPMPAAKPPVAPVAAVPGAAERPPVRIPTTSSHPQPSKAAIATSSTSSAQPLPDKAPAQQTATPPAARPTGLTGKLGLNLDQVVSDYLKRSSEQGKLDVRVLAPSVFTAGKAVALKVRISRGIDPEPEAVVTVKVIGTAFKPQVFMSRADRSGVANFSFSLPAFSAGTAAIVIEAQSTRGRGELKQLIRRT